MINSHATQKHFGTKKNFVFAFLKMRIKKKKLVKNVIYINITYICTLLFISLLLMGIICVIWVAMVVKKRVSVSRILRSNKNTTFRY